MDTAVPWLGTSKRIESTATRPGCTRWRWIRRTHLLGVLVLLATSARAGDWYVDAVAGDDSHGGTSAQDAWRTLTHALATIPPAAKNDPQVLHVASGLYDAALGEVFPLTLERGFIVSGPQAGLAVIEGTGSPLLTLGHGADPGFANDSTVLERLEIRGGSAGVQVHSENASPSNVLRDLSISGASGAAVETFAMPGSVSVRLERVEATTSAFGLTVIAASLATCTVLAEDCRFAGNGAGVSATGAPGGAIVTLRRVRIEGNGTGIHASASLFGGASVSVEDSLIATNAADGWSGNGSFDGSSVSATFLRSTLASNGGTGVFGILATHVALDGCILWGNGDDVNHVSISIAYCDVEDGDGVGTSGNFSADPRFVDAAQGDFRVGWASPCIGTGDPATPIGVLDLARNPRPIDGDLDTSESPDVGAYEFAPLYSRTSGELGSLLELELWGEQQAATTLYFTRRGLVAPQPTPFGELELDPVFLGVFRVTTAGSGPPKTIRRPIPNDPSLLGRTFAFQALTDSALAPLGRAYTNAIEFTIVP